MALVEYNLIKELSESISKKDKRFFKAKLKDSLNGKRKTKRDKKIEEIQRLLLAATKGDKKPGKKKDLGKLPKRPKPDKKEKTFTQFESDSESGSGSSGSSSGSETEGAEENSRPKSEDSSGTSDSEPDAGEKNDNWTVKRTLHQSRFPDSLGLTKNQIKYFLTYVFLSF